MTSISVILKSAFEYETSPDENKATTGSVPTEDATN
ncbi:hypothetical protein PC116_g18595 [Phytophthora cactorum]|nr:hypothetical protein PC114_g24213 [Phytophthora cactorum]KAG3172015.1 hypothetical protein PC128_g18608 [Phytophthora cactorum]KAG4233191.1 hypothetical protein PC116_g18595 [Phytophthora cactorum]